MGYMCHYSAIAMYYCFQLLVVVLDVFRAQYALSQLSCSCKVYTLLSSTLKQARMDSTTCSTNNSHATTNTNLHEYMYVTLSSEWQFAKSTTHSWTHAELVLIKDVHVYIYIHYNTIYML